MKSGNVSPLCVVGVLHFVLRRSFLLVSFDRDRAYEQGLRVRWWDFLFYAAFGLVVTSFVRIAGVLLVFSYLIVPAVCGINLAPIIPQPWRSGSVGDITASSSRSISISRPARR